MFIYSNSYEEAKYELEQKLIELKKKKYHIFEKKLPVLDGYFINKLSIKSKTEATKRVVITAGLHGIEGYVGHSCIIQFLDRFLPKLEDDCEVIIYHVVNPFGMKHYYRTNENNVDLNRNFSQHNFKTTNSDYNNIKTFFRPRLITSKTKANFSYYTSLMGLIRKYGIPTLNKGILFGQNIDSKGLYYSGIEYEESTKQIINELPLLLDNKLSILWIDLHTGYGPRYQMSIVNSKYEKEQTKTLKNSINYPLILGVGTEDFYDIDGDMIEFIYSTHKKLNCDSNLLALCFEFGTLGDKTRKSIESLKSLTFSNSMRFYPSTIKLQSYTKDLMKEQFMPSEEKWRIKASEDFIQATSELLKYKNFMQK